MNRSRSVLAVATIALAWVLTSNGSALARDSQDAGAPATRPAVAGKALPNATPQPDIARQVDRLELIEGLLDGDGETDLMKRVARRMHKSYQQLAQKYDAGPLTQEIQRRIVRDLSRAIELARRMRGRPSSSASQPSENRPKQQKGKPAGRQKTKSRRQADARAVRPRAASPAARPSHGTAQDAVPAGPLEETRRPWGNIPPQDRDQVVQGWKDEIISKYRQQVTRYYEALSTAE